MVNAGQQQRLAQKLERNLKQVLRDLDGLQITRSTNAVGDNLLTISDGSWATTDVFALIKIQEIPLATFPAQGLPVHKLMICVEGDNATLGSVKGSACQAGYFAEFICRMKDLGCGIEVFVTALGTQPADQATDQGTFNSGSSSRLLRHIRASVDVIGMGQ
jgi:hypothetical protein